MHDHDLHIIINKFRLACLIATAKYMCTVCMSIHDIILPRVSNRKAFYYLLLILP